MSGPPENKQTSVAHVNTMVNQATQLSECTSVLLPRSCISNSIIEAKQVVIYRIPLLQRCHHPPRNVMQKQCAEHIVVEVCIIMYKAGVVRTEVYFQQNRTHHFLSTCRTHMQVYK